MKLMVRASSVYQIYTVVEILRKGQEDAVRHRANSGNREAYYRNKCVLTVYKPVEKGRNEDSDKDELNEGKRRRDGTGFRAPLLTSQRHTARWAGRFVKSLSLSVLVS